MVMKDVLQSWLMLPLINYNPVKNEYHIALSILSLLSHFLSFSCSFRGTFLSLIGHTERQLSTCFCTTVTCPVEGMVLMLIHLLLHYLKIHRNILANYFYRLQLS